MQEENAEFFSIGQTQMLTGIPIERLRYYDQIELVIPFYRKPSSKYRYYSLEQLYQLDLIKYLRDELGLSLEKISQFIKSSDQSQSALIAFLQNCEEEYEKKIASLMKDKDRLHQKIDSMVVINTNTAAEPVIRNQEQRKCYFQTNKAVTTHEAVQVNMRKFEKPLKLNDNIQICCFFSSDMNNMDTKWSSNGIGIMTDKVLNLPFTYFKKGTYFCAPFKYYSEKSFDKALLTMKKYVQDNHLTVDNQFFLIVDLIDGAAALSSEGYSHELKIFIN